MLTEKQEAILDYIRSVQAQRGVPPSTREIQRHFGYESQNAAMNHLRALARKGQLHQVDGATWGLKVSEVQGHFELPIYGTIPAGVPSMQEQQPKETITFDPAVFRLRRPERLWGLEVHGDSMIDAHILDGDIAVLERREAKPGDIVAALVDETTTTLKRLAYVKGKPVLKPENARYALIVPKDRLEIQGVFVGLIGRAKR
ncbi:transcriptional repressor LexA [Opitutus terrae]|uniref:LexA repressor n=1 Tax=Opitutus terrae (strain DSM 11246 / JCM 15787 / PB90-1) TaxID=452637 RepID=LEXA_OPITP|nr:transcriptional repressor LexA [Opitutus terrae]B1ZZZ4.1 RecName: Full=LexA repressor [Opitutus terrae PB90-1]ACB77330.1 transcriptional repressor, LexA family [Opitutus terrae PB90-1]